MSKYELPEDFTIEDVAYQRVAFREQVKRYENAIDQIQRSFDSYSYPHPWDEDEPPTDVIFGVCYGLALALHALGAAERPDLKDYSRHLEPRELAKVYTAWYVKHCLDDSE